MTAIRQACPTCSIGSNCAGEAASGRAKSRVAASTAKTCRDFIHYLRGLFRSSCTGKVSRSTLRWTWPRDAAARIDAIAPARCSLGFRCPGHQKVSRRVGSTPGHEPICESTSNPRCRVSCPRRARIFRFPIPAWRRTPACGLPFADRSRTAPQRARRSEWKSGTGTSRDAAAAISKS